MMTENSPYTEAVDTHNAFEEEIESEIQARARNKDSKFSFFLTAYLAELGIVKFLRHQKGFQIYLVDANWIRDNLDVTFGHGGSGMTYPFIVLNEVWVSDKHSRCICVNIQEGQAVSQQFLDSTILHEIVECEEMKTGKRYWEAHLIASKA